MEQKYKPSWREPFTVRSYDIGMNRRMRISSVCSYFQEIANKHATHLDAGYHFMQQTGKVWVLSRLFMNIRQLPAWGQEFYAETWPLGIERIFFRRDYQIDNGSETLINATSWWILLDLKTRRPSLFSLDEGVLKANEGRYAMVMPSEGFLPVSGENSLVREAKYSDLDQNRHVNNARYAEWIFDILDMDLLENRQPVAFAIEYKQEVKAGDRLTLRKECIENDGSFVYHVEGRNEETGQVCLRAKIGF